MKKLNLHLEDLTVETFDTGDAAGLRGTVQANDSFDSPGYTACRASCAYACGESDECTPECPVGTATCGCGTGGQTMDDSCDTDCRASCLYAC